MDLLTVGNTTFTGDQRVSVQVRNQDNWGLVIEKVVPADAGRYVCTLETFPKKSLFLLLQVNGPEMEIVNSSQGLVYSAGSYLSMKCVYRNSSLAPQPVTTPHPLFPVQNHWHLPSDTLLWRHNNKTFSLRNRKRVRAAWTGSAVVSTLSIKSAIKEDSGNYSCHLPSASLTVTASLQILKAEHSSELKPETLQTAGAPLKPSSSLLLILLFLLISSPSCLLIIYQPPSSSLLLLALLFHLEFYPSYLLICLRILLLSPVFCCFLLIFIFSTLLLPPPICSNLTLLKLL